MPCKIRVSDSGEIAHGFTSKPTPFAIKARGVFHMSFSYSFDLLSALEILGIVLAVIGFLNLSTKLDKMFSKMEKGFVRYADGEIFEARSFWPPHKNVKNMALAAFKSLPLATAMYGLLIFMTGWWVTMWQGYLGLPTLLQTAVVFSIAIGLVLNELFSTFILTRFFALVAHIFSRAFRLLAIPPSGMTGTLGLILTLASFIIGRM
ncbi:MAG: hypothetical protein L3J04_06275 [Robiginitomaculum sp.]|nr:hypothetical protein [Robiginitomaculum sp.]